LVFTQRGIKHDKLGSSRDMMKIKKITENKKQFLDLLFLADEQENMIDKYLPNGDFLIEFFTPLAAQ